MEGLWNKLSGSESAAIVDNMTTGVRSLPSISLQPEPLALFWAC
jgi:hypothetical protein